MSFQSLIASPFAPKCDASIFVNLASWLLEIPSFLASASKNFISLLNRPALLTLLVRVPTPAPEPPETVYSCLLPVEVKVLLILDGVKICPLSERSAILLRMLSSDLPPARIISIVSGIFLAFLSANFPPVLNLFPKNSTQCSPPLVPLIAFDPRL